MINFFSYRINSQALSYASAYCFQNRIYAVLDYGSSSSVYIFDQTGEIFGKDFSTTVINSIAPCTNGLILYSIQNGYIYLYSYNTTLMAYQNYIGVKYLTFKPITNGSFIALSQQEFQIFDSNANNLTSDFAFNLKLTLIHSYSIYLDSGNQEDYELQTFTSNNNTIYFLSGINNLKYYFTSDNINNEPVPFTSYSPYAVSNQSNKSTTNSIIESNTGINFTNPIVGALVISMIIGIIFYIFYHDKRNIDERSSLHDNSPMYPRSTQENNNLNATYIIEKHNNDNISNKNICHVCGSYVLSGDIFCQNCGNRL